MATKKEVWTDNRGVDWDTEATALIEDLFAASGDDNELLQTDAGRAAVDALHEYAHRGDKPPSAHDSATALPEGVPPELDDWAKRWEWITARVTEEQCRELQAGDEVRIGLKWCAVRHVFGDNIGIVVESYWTDLVPKELAVIANEVRYNGR